MLNFFLTGLIKHGGLNLKDMAFLVQVCKKLSWQNGVLELIKSTCCKSLFVLASLEEKFQFVEALLNEDFVLKFVERDELQSSGFIKQLKAVTYEFPYVSVTWLMLEPLQEVEFEFKRY